MMTKEFKEFILDVTRDDLNNIVAEVWHRRSGKTLAISEQPSERHAVTWAKRLLQDIGQDHREVEAYRED